MGIKIITAKGRNAAMAPAFPQVQKNAVNDCRFSYKPGESVYTETAYGGAAQTTAVKSPEGFKKAGFVTESSTKPAIDRNNPGFWQGNGF